MEYSVSTEQQLIFMGIQEQMTYFRKTIVLHMKKTL